MSRFAPRCVWGSSVLLLAVAPALFADDQAPANGRRPLEPSAETSAAEAHSRKPSEDWQRFSGVIKREGLPTLGELPAEFEPQQAIVVGGSQMIRELPELFAQLVTLTKDRVKLIALVDGPVSQRRAERELNKRHIAAKHVQYLQVRHNSMWTRDFGPVIVKQPSGKPAIVDAWYKHTNRTEDDAVPAALGEYLKLPVVNSPLWIDGGNLLTNGQGLFLATFELVTKNAAPAVDANTVRKTLGELYGAKDVLFMQPLAGELTGHIDMFATFVSPDTIVVGQFNPKDDAENARILDSNAARLAAWRGPKGEKLRVVRIPMPPHADGVWRSSTNVIYANQLLIVPVFPRVDPHGSQVTLRMFAQLMPNWQVIGIDAQPLADLGGGLHCVTMNVSLLGEKENSTENQPTKPAHDSGRRQSPQ